MMIVLSCLVWHRPRERKSYFVFSLRSCSMKPTRTKYMRRLHVLGKPFVAYEAWLLEDPWLLTQRHLSFSSFCLCKDCILFRPSLQNKFLLSYWVYWALANEGDRIGNPRQMSPLRVLGPISRAEVGRVNSTRWNLSKLQGKFSPGGKKAGGRRNSSRRKNAISWGKFSLEKLLSAELCTVNALIAAC